MDLDVIIELKNQYSFHHVENTLIVLTMDNYKSIPYLKIKWEFYKGKKENCKK